MLLADDLNQLLNILPQFISTPIKQHPKNILSTDIFHETARILDRNKLMMLVLNEFEKNYIEYKHGKNIADIINYLKENSNFLGKEISVNHQQKLKVGICEDIDIKGNLILNIDGTIDKINYGDIFESIS